MTKPLSYQEFNKVYQQVVTDVLKFWAPSMQEEIAKHNQGWANESINFQGYLSKSTPRYYHVYLEALENNVKSLCDVGGFWGVFPITMQRLGFEVSMTEALKYYSVSFDNLFKYIKEQGVTIHDYDPFEAEPPAFAKSDMVTNMAVLEHYPHSPKQIIENLKSMLKEGGILYLEVPNILYWVRRLDMLKGKSPLSPIAHIYHSETPFTGHHHEYTMEELKLLADLSHLSLEKEYYFNYTQTLKLPLIDYIKVCVSQGIFTSLSAIIANVFCKNTREVIAISTRMETK